MSNIRVVGDKKLTMKMRPISSLPVEKQAEARKNYEENLRWFELANDLGFEDPAQAEEILGPDWENTPIITKIRFDPKVVT